MPPRASRRLVSLDAFRGLTIAGMLLVNNVALGPATPAHLTHAAWNRGVHFADLVFPWFLLIAGVSLPFSAASYRARGGTGWAWATKAVRRAALLIMLGWLVDSTVARTPVLGLGVLQLIGLASLVGALLYPLSWRWRAVIAAALLAGHWAALRFFPVPGLGAGRLDETANLIHYLDTYLQPLHLRGLISVLPTGALVLIGTLEGDVLRRARRAMTPAWLALIGVLLTGTAVAWSLDLPFSKPLWTAPYILLAAGLGTITLSAMHLLAEGLRVRSWAFPLAVFGQNAIVAYVAPILIKVHVLQGWSWPAAAGPARSLQDTYLGLLRTQFGGVTGGWLYTASYLTVWWLVLLYLRRRGWLLRV